MILKRTCAHVHNQTREWQAPVRRIDVTGTVFQGDTHASDAPVVAAEASARLQTGRPS
jgi:hypothetical protein